MKNRESIFITKYILSAYDGEVNVYPFSTLEKAMDYCNNPEYGFIENPLIENEGWLIEEYILDYPEKNIKFYNQKGIEIKL
jgi:hypothetical protein